MTYKIVYKKGVENTTADALSRRPDQPFSSSSAIYCAMYACQPQWLSLVSQSYETDEHAKTLLIKLALDNNSVPDFSLVDGLLCYKHRVWIGSYTDLHLQLMSAFHYSVVGGALRSPSNL
jgi:hypothetical protein